MHSFYLKIATFSLLCVLSIFVHFFIDGYLELGEQLLANGDFSMGIEGWEIKTADETRVAIVQGEMKIQSANTEASTHISQQLPVAVLGETVVLKATAKSAHVSEGEKSWHEGRILLMQYRQERVINRTPHELATFTGTVDWKPYNEVFHIQKGISEARVILLLHRVTGELYAKDVSLFQAAANSVYSIAKWSLMAGWFVFAIALFSHVLRAPAASGWVQPALTILAIVCIVVGTTIPGDLQHNLKSDLMEEILGYSEPVLLPVSDATKNVAGMVTADKYDFPITKWAHFGLFGFLTFLLLSQTEHPKLHIILIRVLMLACGTEIVQLFIEERGPTLSDVAIDMAGSTAGLLLWFIVRRHPRRGGGE